MRKIAVLALKGGVGKSSVVAGLGLALSEQNYKVGFLDLDVTGSNLYSALGLRSSPKYLLDTQNEKIVVPQVDDYWLLSIASYAGEDNAVLWEESHNEELTDTLTQVEQLSSQIENLKNQPEALTSSLEIIRRSIDDVLASSKWRFVSELISDEIVTWPQPLDFLIADLPPSTSSEMFSFLDQVTDLHGVFIVSQPSKLSVTGLKRTVDLLRVKQIPIIGLVANQDGFLNQHMELEYQFLSPKVDLKKLASKMGIPFLLSIPQTSDLNKIKPYFKMLAERIITTKPVVLKDVTLVKKLKRKILKGVASRL